MKKTAINIVALMSGIVVVCFAAKLYRGWSGAEFAQHALISCASAAVTWRCISFAKRNGTPSSGNPRLGFALRVAFWIAISVTLFVYFKLADR
jgi:hypothetical protein